MVQSLMTRSACVADLKRRARRRIPGFAFDYVEGGCNADSAVRRNREALERVCLRPDYLAPHAAPALATTFWGRTWAAPLGVAPLGLSGVVWPRASVFHARAARRANVPFVLSTLATVSIETAAEAAGESFWFQLYPPTDHAIRDDLMRRARAAGCETLVVTIDVPAPGRRPRDTRNGLAVPPRVSARTLWQSAARPAWALATLREGTPRFASLMPYFEGERGANLQDVAQFVRTTLKDVVDERLLGTLRDAWPGRLVVKGITHAGDARRAVALGADGVVVSNHGGRQLDAARAAVDCVAAVADAVGADTVVMADSGVESGVDVARFLAHGARLVFAGRALLYGVGAHGETGAAHALDLLSEELEQVMAQLHCATPDALAAHLSAHPSH